MPPSFYTNDAAKVMPKMLMPGKITSSLEEGQRWITWNIDPDQD
jgi:hypothetical protein